MILYRKWFKFMYSMQKSSWNRNKKCAMCQANRTPGFHRMNRPPTHTLTIMCNNDCMSVCWWHFQFIDCFLWLLALTITTSRYILCKKKITHNHFNARVLLYCLLVPQINGVCAGNVIESAIEKKGNFIPRKWAKMIHIPEYISPCYRSSWQR